MTGHPTPGVAPRRHPIAKVGDYIVTRWAMGHDVQRVTPERYYWAQTKFVEKGDIVFAGDPQTGRRLVRELKEARERADTRAQENQKLYQAERRALIDVANAGPVTDDT